MEQNGCELLREGTEADFDFTVDILSAFFAQSRIRRSLATIADVEVTGWEKWWQVELAMFLCDHGQISEWDIEEEFLTDRRRGVTKDSVAADISFRRKKHATDKLIILELKQDTDWKRCVANMLPLRRRCDDRNPQIASRSRALPPVARLE